MYQKWVLSARCSVVSQNIPLISVNNIRYTKQLFVFSFFLYFLCCVFLISLHVPPTIITNVFAFQVMLFIYISPSPSWPFIPLTLYYIILFFPPACFCLDVAFTNVCISSIFILIFCKFSFLLSKRRSGSIAECLSFLCDACYMFSPICDSRCTSLPCTSS